MIVYGDIYAWAVMDIPRKKLIGIFAAEIGANVFRDRLNEVFPGVYQKISLNDFEAEYCEPIIGKRKGQ